MRPLILTISSILLLAIQVHAQQPYQNPQPEVRTNNNVDSQVTVTNVVVAETNSTLKIQDLEPQRVKNFTKTFALNKSDRVNLFNEYGSITIKTWEKNEIKVDAEIKAFADTDNEAQKMLDLASINASKAGNEVSFITDINNKNNWSGNTKRREVKVYMTVYMPSTNTLKAAQEYGNIVMGDHHGATTLTVEYGSLTTGALNNSNNVIRIEYSGAKIKSVNQAKINTEYGSGINIGSAGALTINAEHTNIKIGSLKGKSTANLEYGRITADDISDSFSINAEYSHVSLGFNASFRAILNVATSYGSFKYGSNITAKRRNIDDDDRYSSNKSYTGLIGKGDHKGESIIVNSEYSDIIFK